MKLSSSAKRAVLASVMVVAASPLLALGASATGAPGTPTGVTLVSGNRLLNVTWTGDGSSNVLYIARATATGHPSRVCRTTLLSCTITSLTNGILYDVTVVARNGGGTSGPSVDQTQYAGVATKPLSVHARAAVASAIITWAPPIASGVSAITGYVATATGGSSCSTSGNALNPPLRTCTIPQLSKGVTYQVTVTATNAYGSSAPSKPTSVTPQ